MPLKLVVVGAGSHSQRNHLPALARYVSAHPGQVTLAGLCDLRLQHAQAMAETYGFARAYAGLDDMLRTERPDGCIAVTPVAVTAEITERIIRAGVPLLMEKPPGAALAEAQHLVELIERYMGRVMVSMNRRFDPAICAARRWWGERQISYLRARIVRIDRREPEFAYGTAIHPLDAMRAIAGDVASYRVQVQRVGGVRWYGVHLRFAAGASGLLEVLPSAGVQAESYVWCGDGAYVEAGVGEHDTGAARGWQDGTLVLQHDVAEGEPLYVQNGTYAETVAFLSALQSGIPMHPSPVEVLQSVEVCQTMLEQA
jgi:predicted dehydrogenase